MRNKKRTNFSNLKKYFLRSDSGVDEILIKGGCNLKLYQCLKFTMSGSWIYLDYQKNFLVNSYNKTRY